MSDDFTRVAIVNRGEPALRFIRGVADYNRDSTYNELHGEKTLNLTDNIFQNHKGWTWGEGANA